MLIGRALYLILIKVCVTIVLRSFEVLPVCKLTLITSDRNIIRAHLGAILAVKVRLRRASHLIVLLRERSLLLTSIVDVLLLALLLVVLHDRLEDVGEIFRIRVP